MNTASTCAQHGSVNESRSFDNSSMSGERRNIKQVGRHKTSGVDFNIISSVLVMLTGMAVYMFSGLYDAVDSIVLKISVAYVISFIYLKIYHAGLYPGRSQERKVCCGYCGRCQHR